MSILSEAEKVINGGRQDTYGNPENSFKIIANLWSAYLNGKFAKPITAIDVAHMMALFKIARMLGQKPCRDNYVDAAGYIAIAWDRLTEDIPLEDSNVKQ